MNRRVFLQSVIAVPLLSPSRELRVTLGVQVPHRYRVSSAVDAQLERLWALSATLPIGHPLVIEAQRSFNRLQSLDMERPTLKR